MLAVLAAPASAQQAPAGPASATSYSLFFRGVPAGSMSVDVRTDATGTTIVSDGRLSPPLNITLRRSEIKYTPDWTPVSLDAEGTFNGTDAQIRTRFANGSAVTTGHDGTTPIDRTQPVSAKVVVLPNVDFGAYAAVAKRLATDLPGTELRGYVPPQVEIAIRVLGVQNEQAQVGTTVFPVRRYNLLFIQPTGDLPVTLVTTAQGDLVSVSIASQAIELLRADLASPNARTQVFANPGDTGATIPAAGFNLGATVTKPKNVPAGTRVPAVVLLGDANTPDRDGVLAGVPTLGQLAGGLADAGYLAVRFDKRGYGQSGGRSESATLSDMADDVRAVVKWLAARDDVDKKRIAVMGHGEGAMIALLTASRDGSIAAVVSIAGPSTNGADQFLEQQQLTLNLSILPQTEKDKRIAMQKQVQQAVLTGKGWEGIPPDVRREADTPWFQSLLTYDPVKVLGKVKQPLLILHGAIDQQVPVDHADKLAALARKESKSKSVDVIVVRGVNHLLVPAPTGATSEYATLTDRNVSKDLVTAATGWLKTTFDAIR